MILLENDSITKVWIDQSKLCNPIRDCTVIAFASDDVLKKEKAIRRNAAAVRTALVSIMQTHPLFTDTLRSALVSDRVCLFLTEILIHVRVRACHALCVNEHIATYTKSI